MGDDPRLTQGSTTTPPPLMAVQDWPVEAACALGFCGWQGEDLESVGQVEEFFARACFEADQKLGEPAACRWFLNWFDDTPRTQMRKELAEEVTLAIEIREYNLTGASIPTDPFTGQPYVQLENSKAA